MHLTQVVATEGGTDVLSKYTPAIGGKYIPPISEHPYRVLVPEAEFDALMILSDEALTRTLLSDRLDHIVEDQYTRIEISYRLFVEN